MWALATVGAALRTLGATVPLRAHSGISCASRERSREFAMLPQSPLIRCSPARSGAVEPCSRHIWHRVLLRLRLLTSDEEVRISEPRNVSSCAGHTQE